MGGRIFVKFDVNSNGSHFNRGWQSIFICVRQKCRLAFKLKLLVFGSAGGEICMRIAVLNVASGGVVANSFRQATA
jgi:hypothetical protein